jgi:hypothetical protein
MPDELELVVVAGAGVEVAEVLLVDDDDPLPHPAATNARATKHRPGQRDSLDVVFTV